MEEVSKANDWGFNFEPLDAEPNPSLDDPPSGSSREEVLMESEMTPDELIITEHMVAITETFQVDEPMFAADSTAAIRDVSAMSGHDFFLKMRTALVAKGVEGEAVDHWLRKVKEGESTAQEILQEEQAFEERQERYKEIYLEQGKPYPGAVQ